MKKCYNTAIDLQIKIDKYTKLSRKNAIKKFTQTGDGLQFSHNFINTYEFHISYTTQSFLNPSNTNFTFFDKPNSSDIAEKKRKLDLAATINDFYLFKIKKKFNDERDEVIRWFNTYLSTPFVPKKPQLFLYGLPDTGKSTFIELMMSNLIIKINKNKSLLIFSFFFITRTI